MNKKGEKQIEENQNPTVPKIYQKEVGRSYVHATEFSDIHNKNNNDVPYSTRKRDTKGNMVRRTVVKEKSIKTKVRMK